ncbi:cupin domain-containing protein [Roseomonas soli]|uniref:Cupin domain-containing protein n=2 Tax=Neoroseomonas soli TaxID=1081025 RepID=A0A9X9X3Z7_9PROT|nr:cupin domain-containing protein [Neoroseomonas soli]
MGVRYDILLTAAESGGSVGVFKDTVPPGEGPPLHLHQREDEVFHILEGRFRLWCGDRRWDVGPGETALLPRGVPHTYRNIGDGPGRKLVVVTPGGFEAMFGVAAERGLRLPEDVAAFAELAGRRFGVELLGPPPQD